MSKLGLSRKRSRDGDEPVNSDARLVAKKALHQIMEPLAGFVLDSGVSAGELNVIFREATIRTAAAKQLSTSDRINISGIAAITGISRAEISRTLKNSPQTPGETAETQQQSTNRLLSGWHEDPRFVGHDGHPSELKIYGRGTTFDSLAKKYGLGISTRAILDELIRTDSIELLPNQKIRAKTSVAAQRGMSVTEIKAFGDRATELLSTMLSNMRSPDTATFIANLSEGPIRFSSLPLFRKEVSIKGADLLVNLKQWFQQNPAIRVSSRSYREDARVSVTIFYNESYGKKAKKRLKNGRQNFRRRA